MKFEGEFEFSENERVAFRYGRLMVESTIDSETVYEVGQFELNLKGRRRRGEGNERSRDSNKESTSVP